MQQERKHCLGTARVQKGKGSASKKKKEGPGKIIKGGGIYNSAIVLDRYSITCNGHQQFHSSEREVAPEQPRLGNQKKGEGGSKARGEKTGARNGKCKLVREEQVLSGTLRSGRSGTAGAE